MQTEEISAGRHPALAWLLNYVASLRDAPQRFDDAQTDLPRHTVQEPDEHGTLKVAEWLRRCLTDAPGPEVLDLLEEYTQRIAGKLAAIEEHCQRLQAQLGGPNAPPAEAASGTRVGRHPPGLTADDLHVLGSRGLFILGCARSGTSILCKCLNRSREVFMLEEANFFLSEQIVDFVEHFNRLHQEMGNYRYKGTYVPPPALPEQGPLAMLTRLAKSFPWVGEKTAIGPHDYPGDWARRYLDFHSCYFLGAKYLLILRAPTESIWSMHKMFPDRPLARLFDAWLRTVDLSIEVYRNFPEVRMLFFERLGAETIERLAASLGIALEVPVGMFSDNYIHSHLDDGELPAGLSQRAEWCRACLDIYRELRDHTAAETHRYAASDNELEFFNGLQWRIALALKGLSLDSP